jgi:FlaG/FlaF family flagellin (archaellin)
MRQPTFARRRTRQQRLLRTGIGVVVIIVLAALIANLAGGKKKTGSTPPPGVAQVAFVASVKGETGAKSAPSKDAVSAEGQQIVSMLNDWYEQAFVNTDKFGDGTFPDIAKGFDAAARASFTRDLTTLTIGEARTEVMRVDPTTQTAKVTVYFNNGTPTIAIAAVHFAANATMKQSGAYPLKIDQVVTYNFQKTGQGWVVTYYSGNQTQNSIVPSPSPSAS